MRELLDSLRKSNLKLQHEKFQFLLVELSYLEHVITEDVVRPDPLKVAAI